MTKRPLYKECVECGKIRTYIHYSPRCMECASRHKVIKPPEERFWKHVKKTESCWEWTGSKYHHGYGSFNVYKKRDQAHRFSWTIHNGPIPVGFNILHKCDNTSCVNPEHLSIGTQKDNVQDMLSKGRQRKKATFYH